MYKPTNPITTFFKNYRKKEIENLGKGLLRSKTPKDAQRDAMQRAMNQAVDKAGKGRGVGFIDEKYR